jgi:hypothetical protein
MVLDLFASGALAVTLCLCSVTDCAGWAERLTDVNVSTRADVMGIKASARFGGHYEGYMANLHLTTDCAGDIIEFGPDEHAIFSAWAL